MWVWSSREWSQPQMEIWEHQVMVIEEKGAGTVIGGGGEGGSAADVADWLTLMWCQHVPPMGSCSLLQGIFPNQGSNPGLLHCRQILYQLSHWGSPRRLEWVAYPFSSGSARPRNQTGVSCIVGGFFILLSGKPRKAKCSQVSNLNSNLKRLELDKQIKPKVSRKYEIMKSGNQ